MRPLILILIASITALPGMVRAQTTEAEPIVTDRPDFTESAEVVPIRRIQLEGGYTFTHAGSAKEHSIGELLLRINAGPRLEFRLGFNSYITGSDSGVTTNGFEDTSLGLKVKLMDGEERAGLRRPDVALIAAATFPTGSSGLRENHWQPEIKLCLAWDLSDRLALSMNLNYGHVSEGGSQYHQFSGSLSLGHTLTDRVGAYLEYYGFTPGSFGGSNQNYLNGGFTYLVNNDYQLDVRVGSGLHGVRNHYFVGVGAARRF